MKTFEKKIAKEDLLLFVNACLTCTGQEEFYETSFSQKVTIKFLHQYILVNYRNIYSCFLALDINHFNKLMIIKNLLANGKNIDKTQRKKEITNIYLALEKLPPQRVYKLFVLLAKEKVNNRTTKALIKNFIYKKRDYNFDAIKYGSKVKKALRHVHSKLPEDLNNFLYKGYAQNKKFDNPLLENFRKAHYSREFIYELPFTIAEGLAEKFKIPRELFIKRIESQMTVQEKLRLQNSVKEFKNTKLEIEPEKLSLTSLASYILSLGIEDRISNYDLFDSYLLKASKKIVFPFLKTKKVVAILDRSFSSSGSSEKQKRPLAIALAINYLLKELCHTFYPIWTLPTEKALIVYPKGQTNIAEKLLEALELKPDLLIIVSDGFENSPTNATEEIIRIYQDKIEKQKLPIIHLNPVFNTENYEPKSLSKRIITLGIRNAEELPMLIEFSNFALDNTSLEELESFLKGGFYE